MKIESTDPDNELTCDIEKLGIKGLTENEWEGTLNRIHLFVRLWRRLGWTMRELDLVMITLQQPDITMDDLIVQTLSYTAVS